MVDLENIHSPGIEGCEALSATDKIIIFYSKNANQLLIPQVLEIIHSKAAVEFQEVTVGTPSALDFQLVFHLGVLAGRFRGKELCAYIISNDKGYDCVESYADSNLDIENVHIYRANSIQTILEIDARENFIVKNNSNEVLSEDTGIVISSSEEANIEHTETSWSDAEEVDQSMRKLKKKVLQIAGRRASEPLMAWNAFQHSLSKSEFYDELCKWYSPNKGHKIYSDLKKLFEEKHFF